MAKKISINHTKNSCFFSFSEKQNFHKLRKSATKKKSKKYLKIILIIIIIIITLHDMSLPQNLRGFKKRVLKFNFVKSKSLGILALNS
jgi:hypothetical protein